MKKALPSFIYAIFLLLLCTILLTLPGSAFPKENWLDKIWFDKWVHIGMFGMLVTVWCWSASKVVLSRTLKRLFVFIAVLFFGYGIAMEFVQQNFVSNRSFDKGDIIADGLGCLLGLGLSVSRYIKK